MNVRFCVAVLSRTRLSHDAAQERIAARLAALRGEGTAAVSMLAAPSAPSLPPLLGDMGLPSIAGGRPTFVARPLAPCVPVGRISIRLCGWLPGFAGA